MAWSGKLVIRIEVFWFKMLRGILSLQDFLWKFVNKGLCEQSIFSSKYYAVLGTFWLFLQVRWFKKSIFFMQVFFNLNDVRWVSKPTSLTTGDQPRARSLVQTFLTVLVLFFSWEQGRWPRPEGSFDRGCTTLCRPDVYRLIWNKRKGEHKCRRSKAPALYII